MGGGGGLQRHQLGIGSGEPFAPLAALQPAGQGQGIGSGDLRADRFAAQVRGPGAAIWSEGRGGGLIVPRHQLAGLKAPQDPPNPASAAQSVPVGFEQGGGGVIGAQAPGFGHTVIDALEPFRQGGDLADRLILARASRAEALPVLKDPSAGGGRDIAAAHQRKSTLGGLVQAQDPGLAPAEIQAVLPMPPRHRLTRTAGATDRGEQVFALVLAPHEKAERCGLQVLAQGGLNKGGGAEVVEPSAVQKCHERGLSAARGGKPGGKAHGVNADRYPKSLSRERISAMFSRSERVTSVRSAQSPGRSA